MHHAVLQNHFTWTIVMLVESTYWAVMAPSIIQECSNHLLDGMFTILLNGLCQVLWLNILYSHLIYWWVMGKGKCCTLSGIGWLKLFNAVLMYPGINECSPCFFQSQSKVRPMYFFLSNLKKLCNAPFNTLPNFVLVHHKQI